MNEELMNCSKEYLIRQLEQADNKNLELIIEINKKDEKIERLNNIIDELIDIICSSLKVDVVKKSI